MSNENRNIPELRFPGFEDEWIKMKLDNLGDIFTGSTPDTSKSELYEGKYPFVSPIDIHNNRYVKSTNKTVSKEGFYGGRVIPKGASLFVCIGSTIGKVGQAEIDVTTNQQINALIPYENYDDNYIYTNLYKSSNKIKKLAATQAVPIINKKTFSNFSIYIPKFKEQKKIGDFFSKLDHQIELEEEKLELLEQQKKGYMQKIFSQELRFKDENRADYPNWKKIAIKEVANLTAGKGKKNENKGKYIIMDMGTVTKNGTMLTHKSTPYESDFLNRGDLVMPKDDIGGGHIIGKTVFIPESHKYVLGDHVYRLEIKNCNSLFLHYYINSDIVNHSLKRKVTGSAQLGLNRKSVEEEVIKIPCLEEQEKIGNLFNKIDNLIELQIDKIGLLKRRKQGLLQKMFV